MTAGIARIAAARWITPVAVAGIAHAAQGSERRKQERKPLFVRAGEKTAMKVLCIGGKCDGQWVDVEREKLLRRFEIKVLKVDDNEDRFVTRSAYDAAPPMEWDYYMPTRYQFGNENEMMFILRHYPMDEQSVMKRMMERYTRCQK